jgi:WD40 repeat protein
MQVKKMAQFEGHTSSIYALERSAEPHCFYTGGADNRVVKWNIDDPEKSQLLMKMPERVFALKFLIEKNILLVGNYVGGIHVIDLETQKEIKLLQYHRQIIFEIQLLPNAESFIALCADGSFSVWSLNDYELVDVKSLGSFKLRSIDFHPTKKEAVIGCEDGIIRVIDLTKFEVKQLLEGHSEGFSVNAVKYSPDGKKLWSGSRDAHMITWDVTEGYKFKKGFQAHKYAIYNIVESPDGKYIVTGSRDKSMKVWDTSTMELMYTIGIPDEDGHTKSINKLMWGDNRYLISTGDDRTVKVWELKI